MYSPANHVLFSHSLHHRPLYPSATPMAVEPVPLRIPQARLWLPHLRHSHHFLVHIPELHLNHNPISTTLAVKVVTTPARVT